MLAALSLDVCESLTGKTNQDARLRAQYLERFKRVNRPAWTMLIMWGVERCAPLPQNDPFRAVSYGTSTAGTVFLSMVI